MNTTIHLARMNFYSHHGCFEEERAIGTRFSVDLWLTYDAARASVTDDVSDAVNYALVYQTVQREMAIPSRLLECVAKRIIDAVKAEFPPVTSVKVRVCKLNPPLGGQMDHVSVEMED